MKIYGVSKEYVCPWCGKEFFVPYQSKGGGRTQWIYKIRLGNRIYYYCSYSCWCKVKNIRKQIKEKRYK